MKITIFFFFNVYLYHILYKYIGRYNAQPNYYLPKRTFNNRILVGSMAVTLH